MTIENPEENSKGKLVDPEIQKEIEGIDAVIAQNEADLKELFSFLKDDMEFLEDDIAHLEHMKDINNFVDEMNSSAEEEGFEKSKIEKYPDEQIKKVEQDIEKAKADIKKMHDLMTQVTIDTLEFQKIKEGFEKVQKDFNGLMTRVDRFREN
jgi:hypothetical protein